MGIVVIGAAFVDIKGFPQDIYIPNGRNVGRIEYIHGGVARNVVEDIANIELRPTYVGIVDDTPLGDAVVTKLRNHTAKHMSAKVIGKGVVSSIVSGLAMDGYYGLKQHAYDRTKNLIKRCLV